MTLTDAVKTCLTKKYATFTGRASRSEYWWFVLAYVIVGIVISLLGNILSLLYFVALIVPALAVGFRRLQDTGRPGWYILIPTATGLLLRLLTPTPPMMADGHMTEMPDMGSMGLLALLSLVQLALAVIFIWWLTRPSQPETNAYGPPPAA